MQGFSGGSVGKAAGVLALIFFSGFATGLLSSNLMEAFEEERSTEFRIEATLQDLAEELSLNPSQMEQIRAILDDVIMQEAELLGELKWNQLEAHQRIVQYLTPEQNQLFNQLIQVANEGR